MGYCFSLPTGERETTCLCFTHRGFQMVTGERHPVFVSLDVFQMGSRRVRGIASLCSQVRDNLFMFPSMCVLLLFAHRSETTCLCFPPCVFCFSLPTGQRQLVYVSLHVCFASLCSQVRDNLFMFPSMCVLLLFAHRSETTCLCFPPCVFCFSLPTGQRQLVYVSLHVCFASLCPQVRDNLFMFPSMCVLLLFAHRSETTCLCFPPCVFCFSLPTGQRQLVYVSLHVCFASLCPQVRDNLFMFPSMCVLLLFAHRSETTCLCFPPCVFCFSLLTGQRQLVYVSLHVCFASLCPQVRDNLFMFPSMCVLLLFAHRSETTCLCFPPCVFCFSLLTGQRQLVYVSLHVCFASLCPQVRDNLFMFPSMCVLLLFAPRSETTCLCFPPCVFCFSLLPGQRQLVYVSLHVCFASLCSQVRDNLFMFPSMCVLLLFAPRSETTCLCFPPCVFCFSLPTGQRQLVYVSLHVCFEWSQVDLAVLQARVQRTGRAADLGNLLGPLPDRLLPLVSVRGHRGHLWG